MVCSSPYWSELVHTGLSWSILVHAGPYWSKLVQNTDTYWRTVLQLVAPWSPLVCSGSRWSPPAHAPPYWCVLVRTGAYWAYLVGRRAQWGRASGAGGRSRRVSVTVAWRRGRRAASPASGVPAGPSSRHSSARSRSCSCRGTRVSLACHGVSWRVSVGRHLLG